MASSTNSHTFPCESCGAALVFAPGTASLTCEYCGHAQAIARGAGRIVEYDFRSARAQARRVATKDLVEGGVEAACTGCGARTVFKGHASKCPYCDSPIVVAQAASEEQLVPESLLPFKVRPAEASQAFEAWVGSLWFAPNDLAARARAEAIDGVYLPYWTYDSQTQSRYRGERGTHYWVSESYTDSEGKRQTRQVRKTRWSSVSGTLGASFDDVLICASTSLPRPLIRALEPWDLSALEPYTPAYLSGFVAERYRVDLEEGFQLAGERMDEVIRTRIRRQIGGDEQRIHSVSTQHEAVTFKHCLLPLWISSFRYGEQVYRFLVNARTAEVSGERPWSWIKITLAVLAGLALAAGLVALLAQR